MTVLVIIVALLTEMQWVMDVMQFQEKWSK